MLLHAGLSYARWSTEAISALEFSQYEHYMQPRIHTIMSQIGYCGLDSEPEHGAQPGAPVNGQHSLDSFVYCKGYVAWDCAAILVQVGHISLCMCVHVTMSHQHIRHAGHDRFAACAKAYVIIHDVAMVVLGFIYCLDLYAARVCIVPGFVYRKETMISK